LIAQVLRNKASPAHKIIRVALTSSVICLVWKKKRKGNIKRLINNINKKLISDMGGQKEEALQKA
jgi:hypothetical protein